MVLLVDDAQLDAERRATLPRDDVDALVEAHLVPVPRPFAHRPDRRSFGHAPGMADVDSRFHEPLDHRARARRTTADHPVQLPIANPRRSEAQTSELTSLIHTTSHAL